MSGKYIIGPTLPASITGPGVGDDGVLNGPSIPVSAEEFGEMLDALNELVCLMRINNELLKGILQ